MGCWKINEFGLIVHAYSINTVLHYSYKFVYFPIDVAQ